MKSISILLLLCTLVAKGSLVGGSPTLDTQYKSLHPPSLRLSLTRDSLILFFRRTERSASTFLFSDESAYSHSQASLLFLIEILPVLDYTNLVLLSNARHIIKSGNNKVR